MNPLNGVKSGQHLVSTSHEPTALPFGRSPTQEVEVFVVTEAETFFAPQAHVDDLIRCFFEKIPTPQESHQGSLSLGIFSALLPRSGPAIVRWIEWWPKRLAAFDGPGGESFVDRSNGSLARVDAFEVVENR